MYFDESEYCMNLYILINSTINFNDIKKLFLFLLYYLKYIFMTLLPSVKT